MPNTEIRFAGFGGQGIILMGIAVARAASIYDKKSSSATQALHRYAVQTQSYGPSARGGHSRCDVKISEAEMYYPFVDLPDILVIMSEQAFRRYSQDINEGGLLILEDDLVKENPQGNVIRIQATRAAEELGTRIVANVVMLGAFQVLTKVISWDALVNAVMDLVPEITHELNMKALERGRDLGIEAVKGAEI